MIEHWWFAVYVALNALIVTLLALNVSYKRIALGVANGDGGKLEMKKAIRAHANGVEHVSIFGLVVLALTLVQASSTLQGVAVIGFSAARVLHGVGMIAAVPQLRRAGATVTYLGEIFGIVALIGYLVTA